MRGAQSDTVTYYERHADSFLSATVHVDLGSLYEPFLALVPEGGLILDAGCGSGRDSRAFLERGYRVRAFDASPELYASGEYRGDRACYASGEVDERLRGGSLLGERSPVPG